MVTKKYWKKPISDFIDLVRKENKNKFITTLNKSFEIYPQVFSPVYSSDTAWFAQKIVSLIQDKRLLEIGAGSGVIACLALIYGATSVVATDINPSAVNNILANAKLHSLALDARMGSVFEPIAKNEYFDVIFWNHPFYFVEETIDKNDMLSLSVYDSEYQSLKDFFSFGGKHLKKDGQLLLGTSNVARINLIKKFAKDAGYSIQLLEKIEVPIYKEKKIKMDLRLYSFKPLSKVNPRTTSSSYVSKRCGEKEL